MCLYDLNIALYGHFIKQTCNKNKKPWDDRIHTDGGKNSQFTSANSLCSSSSNYLLADLNLHPHPYFQTDNSFPELELHKPFVPLLIFVGKIVSFSPFVWIRRQPCRCHVLNVWCYLTRMYSQKRYSVILLCFNVRTKHMENYLIMNLDANCIR